jgi:hypothetical protein
MWGVKRVTKKFKEIATSCINYEVKEYEQYLTGDVYGFQLTDQNGNEISSCWGFYGDVSTNGILDHLDEEWKSIVVD